MWHKWINLVVLGGVSIENFHRLKIIIFFAFERLTGCEAGRNINSICRYKMKLISHIVDTFFIHAFIISVYCYLFVLIDDFGFSNFFVNSRCQFLLSYSR